MPKEDSLKVLVVDDDAISLEVARERLEGANHQVLTRDRALGTSQVILSDRPDCVLLDVMMPGISGDELASLLHQQDRTKETAIILHSSKDEEELAALVEQTGALGAIQKTSDDEAFLAQFARLARELASRRRSA